MGALDATCGGSCAVGVWISPGFLRKPSVQETAERKARDRFGARFHSAEMATGQRRIPGPAGALQEALRRGRDPDKIEAGDGAGPSGNPPPGSRTAGEAGLPGAIRPDEPYWQINLREHWAFKLGSWRRALDTIDVDQFEPTNPLLKTNCAWILEGGWKTTRCQRLCVAILNNSRSEFGDMNIVVGDPTGQIRCVVHKDVVQADSDAIRKGGSLLLKNVPVITFPECIEHMLVVTENELVQCFAPEEEPYLTKKHFDTAEELAAAVSRSMGMSEEDIEAGLAARASQGTPGREGPGRRRAPQSPTAKPTPPGSSRVKAPRPRRGRRRRRRRRRPPCGVGSRERGGGQRHGRRGLRQGGRGARVAGPKLAGGGRQEAARSGAGARAGATRAGRGGEEAREETEGRAPVPGGQQGVETAFDDPPREPAPETEGKDGEKEEAKDGAKESDGG